jgi:quercetin dioxygenase-like cupin family protein
MRISRTPRTGASASSEWITGDARIEELATPEGPSRTQIDSVRFAPGARTRWHRHPVGQVLVITEGTGLVQRHGGEVETIRTGDTVRIEAGEWHWHGATPNCAMTHLAIEELPEDGRTAQFTDAVTDAEYETGYSREGGQPTEPAPPLSRVTVMDQELPEPLATQRVEIRRITIAPGHAAGLHIHNGPVFGSFETGSVIYQGRARDPAPARRRVLRARGRAHRALRREGRRRDLLRVLPARRRSERRARPSGGLLASPARQTTSGCGTSRNSIWPFTARLSMITRPLCSRIGSPG